MRPPWRKRSVFPWRWLLLLTAPIVLTYAIFGESGLLESYRLHLQLNQLEAITESLIRDNERQRTLIHTIRENPEVAQHMYSKHTLMAPSGSVIYRFSEPSDSNGLGPVLAIDANLFRDILDWFSAE